jgi:asparagine synthase (glutamine-hydrolysing)
MPSVTTLSYFYLDEPESDDQLYTGFVEAKRGRVGHHAEICGQGDSLDLVSENFSPVPIFGARREVEVARLESMRLGGYRVALSGLGGDEFLGRAVDARVDLADLLVRLRWLKLARRLSAWAKIWRYPIVRLLAETVRASLPQRADGNGNNAKSPAWIVSRFNLNYGSAATGFSSRALWSWLPSARDWRETHSRLAGILTNLPLTTEETRYPCLDQNLVEFLMSIPRDQLLRPGERRSLMRRALVNIVPNEVLARRTKQLEGRCYVTTLAKHWNELDHILDHSLAARFGILHGPEFKATLRGLATKGRLSIEGMTLLRGLFLELWLRGVVRHANLSAADATEGTRKVGRKSHHPMPGSRNELRFNS